MHTNKSGLLHQKSLQNNLRSIVKYWYQSIDLDETIKKICFLCGKK